VVSSSVAQKAIMPIAINVIGAILIKARTPKTIPATVDVR
jgi:hypothetical protein